MTTQNVQEMTTCSSNTSLQENVHHSTANKGNEMNVIILGQQQ